MSGDEVQTLFNDAMQLLLGDQHNRSPQVATKRIETALTYDQTQCDLWRTVLFIDPDGPDAVKLLRAIFHSRKSFGELTMGATRHYRLQPQPGDSNPVSTMLSVAYQGPLDSVIDLQSPTRISAAWALQLAIHDGKFDEASEVLTGVGHTSTPTVQAAWALIYWRTRRWTDAKHWAEQLFRAPWLAPDDATVKTTERGEPLVDHRMIALGYLIAGISYAHLGEHDIATRWLSAVVADQTGLPSYPVMRRVAYHTLALLHRARGAFAEAQAAFASAKSYGTVDELDADAADENARLLFTSPETIAQRTSYWDAATEPSLERINERKRAEEGSEVLKAALARMDTQVALHEVKAKVHEFAATEKMNEFYRSQGIVPDGDSRYNFVFQGPPGTGKTVTARAFMDIMFGYGVIKRQFLKEVSAADLVGSAVGQAEELTLAALREADGGVIFIDEVYQLTQKGDDAGGSNANVFGKKAAETILKYMEDNPDKCHVIIAGYKYQTDQFIASNPGFKSRFTDYIDFRSYTPDELGEIAELMASQRSPALTFRPDAHKHFVDRCQVLMKDDPENNGIIGDIAGNGRMVRNFIDNARKQINVRLAPLITSGTQLNLEDTTTITVADVDAALDPILAKLF